MLIPKPILQIIGPLLMTAIVWISLMVGKVIIKEAHSTELILLGMLITILLLLGLSLGVALLCVPLLT